MEKNYEDLSDEEKAALIDICKQDPVVFIETICNIELLEYQKLIVRKTFEALEKQDKLVFRTKYLCKPSERVVIDISNEVTCRTCKYRDGWHHLEPCRSCRDFSNWEKTK